MAITRGQTGQSDKGRNWLENSAGPNRQQPQVNAALDVNIVIQFRHVGAQRSLVRHLPWRVESSNPAAPTKRQLSLCVSTESILRGWIYVLTNLAMPGLVKVGFSTKDPLIRAKELGGTGLPHPYKVAYDALIEEPRQVELGVHRELKQHWEAKEFFRVSVDVAVEAVERVLMQQGKSVLHSASKVQKHCADSANHSVLRKAIPARHPRPIEGRTGTVQFVGKCGYCGDDFSVTLTRYDSGAVCPNCYKRNDASDFLRLVFSA